MIIVSPIISALVGTFFLTIWMPYVSIRTVVIFTKLLKCKLYKVDYKTKFIFSMATIAYCILTNFNLPSSHFYLYPAINNINIVDLNSVFWNRLNLNILDGHLIPSCKIKTLPCLSIALISQVPKQILIWNYSISQLLKYF